jgi:hypothetical protein
MPQFENVTNVHLCNVAFTRSAVYEALTCQPDKISATPDDLPAFFLRRVAISISEPLEIIFSMSMSTGQVPDIWRSAIVCPIYKKGPADDPKNYRPVSLTSISCKVIESIVKINLIEHLQNEKLINAQQHGFISKKSTTCQLLECLNDWTMTIEKEPCADIAYIDFCKAFDKVSHLKLLKKLEVYGIKGQLLCWIKAFLSNRKQCVRIGRATSYTADVGS